MKVGLVGFSGAGKSTVFEWLTGAAPDPAKVQQGQLGSTKVPDERLMKMAVKYDPDKLTLAEIQFLDTPGLMSGGEDDRKDNARRLGVIRESDGMCVVLNGYSETDFAKQLTRFRDELLFADLEIVSNRIPKVQAQLKKTKPAKEKEADEFELATLQRVVAAFEAGKPAHQMGIRPEEEKCLRSFQLLTLKPEIVLVNRGDSGFNDPLPADLLAMAPNAVQAPVKLEKELKDLDEETRTMFMADLGMTAFSRDRVIRAIFSALGRIVFFTAGKKEVRSWAMDKGGDAVAAAACIHNDLAARFVRARVVSYTDYEACGYSDKEAKARGLERLEGKTYVVQDGDCMEIL